MKRFKPESLDVVGVTRQLALWTMHLGSSSELVEIVRERVTVWCTEILSRDDIATEQLRTITMALNDIPTTLEVFSDLILDRMMTAEAKQNALFMLAKMADDLMQVGAVFVSGIGSEDVPPPITAREVAIAAGVASGLARAKAAEEGWKVTVQKNAIFLMSDGKARSANKLATDILAKWMGPEVDRRDPKTIREFLEEISAGSDAPFKLRVDARSKKVRN